MRQAAFYYIVIERHGQRLFLNRDGSLNDRFDTVMRFPCRANANQYLRSHGPIHGRADIIGMAK